MPAHTARMSRLHPGASPGLPVRLFSWRVPGPVTAQDEGFDLGMLPPRVVAASPPHPLPVTARPRVAARKGSPDPRAGLGANPRGKAAPDKACSK